MELLNSKVNHKDYMCDHTAWGVELVQAGRLAALQAALRHLPHADHGRRRDPHDRDNTQYIGHYHTGGNPGRHEIDDTQELNYRGDRPGHRRHRIQGLRRPRVFAGAGQGCGEVARNSDGDFRRLADAISFRVREKGRNSAGLRPSSPV